MSARPGQMGDDMRVRPTGKTGMLCSFPSPFPFKNMAVRQRIIALSKKFDLTFLTRKGVDVPEELASERARVLESPFSFKNNYVDLSLYFLWAAYKVLRFGKERFLIVYSFHEMTSVLIGFLSKFLRKAQFWAVDFLDDPELEYNNWRRRKASVKKAVLLPVLRSLCALNRVAFRKADLAVVQGMTGEDRLPRLLSTKYNIPVDRMVIVPNGIDLNLITPSGARAKEAGVFSIFYVGYVSEIRGIGTIIDAVSILRTAIPGVRLVLAGWAKEMDRAWLRDKLERSGLKDKVSYLGVLGSENVWAIIEDSDVCIYPFQNTELSYVFPVKIFEYLALNKPVVASRLEGVSHIIKDRHNGILVTPSDPKEWAEAFYEIYNDSILRRRLSSNARVSIAGFDWGLINDKIIRGLRCMAEGAPRV